MTRRATLLAVALVAATPSGVAASPALAPEGTPLVLDVEIGPCAQQDPQTIVADILALDLGARIVTHELEEGWAHLEVGVHCAEDELTLWVREPAAGTTLSRTISRELTAQSGGERLVGMMLVELVSASFAQPLPAIPSAHETAPLAPEHVRPPVRAGRAPPSSPQLAERWRRSAMAGLRLGYGGASSSSGASARVFLDAPSSWGLSLGAAAESLAWAVDGQDYPETLRGSLMTGWLGAHMHAGGARARARLGAASRLGLGSVGHEEARWGRFFSLVGTASLEVEARPWLALGVGADVQGVIRGLRAPAQPASTAAALSGPRFGLHLSAGVRW